MRKALVILGLMAIVWSAFPGDADAQSRRRARRAYVNTVYYYTDPVVSAPATEVRQSFYSGPTIAQNASLIVRVPDANAEIWFDNAATTQRGMERTFQTPALQQAGMYTIRARWTQNGRAIEQEQRVTVQPGQSVTVVFR